MNMEQMGCYCSNQNALGGSFSRDLFQDATALEELLTQQEDNTDWREWSLLAGDGDAAALIELVSENKVKNILAVFWHVYTLTWLGFDRSSSRLIPPTPRLLEQQWIGTVKKQVSTLPDIVPPGENIRAKKSKTFYLS